MNSQPSSTSIIIDCETLGKEPASVITEIGAIAFDRHTFVETDSILLKPALFQQLALGRTYTADTLEFHARNGTLPKDLSDSTDCTHAVTLLSAFFLKHNPERIWIQGTCFDRPLIEHFCAAVKQPMPWQYWQTTDARSMWHAAFPGIKHAKRPHTALGDCRATLSDLVNSLFHLKGKTASQAA